MASPRRKGLRGLLNSSAKKEVSTWGGGGGGGRGLVAGGTGIPALIDNDLL